MKNSKIVILYIIVAVSLVTLVLMGGAFVIYNHRQDLKQDIKIYRYSLDQEAAGLKQTFDQLVSFSNLLVKNPVVINTLDKHLNRQKPTVVASNMVAKNLDAIAAIKNISTVFLIGLDGICLYGSKKELIGRNYEASIYFRNALSRGNGLYAIMTIASGYTGLYYAQLVKNGTQALGVAVLEIKPNFFHLHSFTNAFTAEPPPPSEIRIGLTTDNNILFNTTESTLVALQPLPDLDSLPPDQKIITQRIHSLGFAEYNRESLNNKDFLIEKDITGTDYYLFYKPLVSKNLSLIHVIKKDWFHRNYHPASSNYSGYYMAMLGLMLIVMLGLLYMLNRRHRQALLAAETLKQEAEQRILDKEKYETIINRNPQGFWLSDFESGVILEVNQSLCQLLNLKSDQIIGHTTDKFLIPDPLDRKTEPLAAHDQQAKNPNDISQEGKLQVHGRQVIDVLINSSCIIAPGTSGKVCFSFFADISERKKEQEQLFLFSQAVEQSASAIVIT
ncbi:MAG: PAS domain S-box protein, partial [Candidatus Electrothrix sp. AR3]|nr:PAS domain S-box protein [Candidatus Electrothrix sp. AR3]